MVSKCFRYTGLNSKEDIPVGYIHFNGNEY